MGSKTATALIRKEHPEYDFWMSVFPNGEIPLKGYLPYRYQSEFDGHQEFYHLDDKAVSAEQLDAIADHLAEKWGQPKKSVVETMSDPEHGIPVNGKWWSVAIPMKYFL